MSDNITTTTEQSWFSRIGDAIKGVLIGVVLFAVSFPVLIWNEGNSVKTYQSLVEGAGATISVDADVFSSDHDGKPIHVTGRAESTATLVDDLFGVSVANSICLNRHVEMFQWKERKESKTEENLGGSATTKTTTKYEKLWSNKLIDSQHFDSATEHANPSQFPVSSQKKQADIVTLGAYTLNSHQVALFPTETSVKLPVLEALNLPDDLKSKAKITATHVFIGNDPGKPAVGDMRIQFTSAGTTNVSVVTAQKGKSFTPYSTSNGKEIDLFKVGSYTASQMFEQAQQENTIFTWILRAVGFVLMFSGIFLVLKPLKVFADVIPLLGSILEVGIMIIAGSIAGALSLVTIALSWIAYRPVIAIAILVVAGGIVYLVRRRFVAHTKVRAVSAN